MTPPYSLSKCYVCSCSSWYLDNHNETQNNCHGPRRVFKLAHGMPRLAALVHVSSSYVNAPFGPQVKEVIYPYPLSDDPDQLFETIDKMTDQELTQFEKEVVLKVFPNTYCAAKSLTEHLVKTWTRSLDLPVVIVRPSGCTGAISEPMPGWVEGLGSYNGITIMMALGKVDGLIGSEVKNGMTFEQIPSVSPSLKTLL